MHCIYLTIPTHWTSIEPIAQSFYENDLVDEVGIIMHTAVEMLPTYMGLWAVGGLDDFYDVLMNELHPVIPPWKLAENDEIIFHAVNRLEDELSGHLALVLKPFYTPTQAMVLRLNRHALTMGVQCQYPVWP